MIDVKENQRTDPKRPTIMALATRAIRRARWVHGKLESDERERARR